MTSGNRLLVAAAALCVLTGSLFLVFPRTPLHAKVIESIPDAFEYERLATSFVRTRVFSQDTVPPFRAEIFRTPAYPLFLAPLFAIFSAPELAVVLVQLALSVLLLVVVYRLAAESGIAAPAAATASLLVALSPNLSFLATKMVTETLFGLVLAVCLLLFNRFRLTLRASDLLAAGICSGALVLIRPIATFFPLVLSAVAIPTVLLRNRQAWFLPLIPTACALVVISPWVARNWILSDRCIVSTAQDRTIYLYSAATVVAAERDITVAAARDSMKQDAVRRFGVLDSTDEGQFWARLAAVGRCHLLRRPLQAAGNQLIGFATSMASPISILPLAVHSGAAAGAQPPVFQQALALLLAGRIAAAIELVRHQRLSRLGSFALAVLAVAVLFQIGLIGFGVVGLVARSGRGLLWLLVPVAYFTILPGPVGDARFRAPIEPLLALFAAVGICVVFDRLKTRRPGSG